MQKTLLTNHVKVFLGKAHKDEQKDYHRKKNTENPYFAAFTLGVIFNC